MIVLAMIDMLLILLLLGCSIGLRKTKAH